MDNLFDKFSAFYDKHGCETVVGVVMFLMVFGWIPSPMLTNQADIKKKMEDSAYLFDKQNALLSDRFEKEEAKTKRMLQLAIAECVRNTSKNPSPLGIDICTEESEYWQKRIISEAVKETKK